MSATRIALVVVLLGVVVGLIAYARGDEHHRGDEIGSWSDVAQVVSTPPSDLPATTPA